MSGVTRITRPSALGMSEPIWGPLIHIFVDEKKIEKDKDLDQVNCDSPS